MKCTDSDLEEEWKSINWKKTKSYVNRIQGKIFLAIKNKEYKKLINLQKLARKSYYFHLFSIHQITTVNQGKYTAGIDGKVCVIIQDRFELLDKLRTFRPSKYEPMPIKRVYIPKPNGGKRPLGIPTIFDRCIQMLYKLILEPEFEYKFHKNSFGFRPQRSTQDAVELIKRNLGGYQEKYILDADLKGFFDNIEHSLILKHFQPRFQVVINKWLKSKIVDNNVCRKPLKGTPQGGVISPLLANVALNEFDYKFNPYPNISIKDIRCNITTIRFADDFVVISSSKQILERIYFLMVKYFDKNGLQFNKMKTKIVERSKGFDFLGFHFIKYPHSYLKVTPSKSSLRKVKRSVKDVLDRNKQVKTDAIIYRLNQIIRGWAMYFRYCNAYASFTTLNHIVFRWVWNWAKRRHPQKGKKWIARKYFPLEINNKWRLKGKHWNLTWFSDIKRRKYNWKVGNLSPMDPDMQEIWGKKLKFT